MRHSKHSRPYKKAQTTVKRVVKSMKNHPIPSIGVLTLGAAGLLSGAYALWRRKN